MTPGYHAIKTAKKSER